MYTHAHSHLPLGVTEWDGVLHGCVFNALWPTTSSVLLINIMSHILQIAHIKNILLCVYKLLIPYFLYLSFAHVGTPPQNNNKKMKNNSKLKASMFYLCNLVGGFVFVSSCFFSNQYVYFTRIKNHCDADIYC